MMEWGISFQWQRSFDQTVWNDIDGKTSSSYMPGDSDVGSYLRVLAGYTDGHGTDETITSDATSLIRNVNDAPEGSVLVSGSPVEDEVLNVDTLMLSDPEGMGEITLQWQSQDALGAWTDIIGANGSSILLGDEEVGKTLRAQASYTDGYGTLEVISSSSTQTIENINDTPRSSIYEGILSQGETPQPMSVASGMDGIPDLNNGVFEIDPFSMFGSLRLMARYGNILMGMSIMMRIVVYL